MMNNPKHLAMVEAAKRGRAQWLKNKEAMRRVEAVKKEALKARRSAAVDELVDRLNEARRSGDVDRFFEILMGAKI